MEQLGYLASTIAHDFNNLLTGIMGNASLALMKLPQEDHARHHVEQILKTAEFASILTAQLLAYSHQRQPEKLPIDLNDLIIRTMDLLTAVLLHNIEVEFKLAPHLPLTKAIPGQLQQIIMNLVINASEAIRGPEGKIIITTGQFVAGNGRSLPLISGSTLFPGEYIYFSVQDTGSGMDEETASRIFEPFFSTKSLGRGLGLAALQEIVQRHDGSIALSTRPGSGATFTVLLPSANPLTISLPIH